jgi:diguanylate cyclase
MDFFRSKNPDTEKSDNLRRALHECERGRDVLLNAAKALILVTKELSVEAEDLDTAVVRDKLDDLAQKLHAGKDFQAVESSFQKDGKELLSYAKCQRRYLKDRETELTDIIETLTAAIASINRENQAFTDNIYAQSTRIEKLTRINDLKELKNELSREVEEAQRTLFEKQFIDERRMEQLSRRVHGLSAELKHVKMGVFRDGLTGAYNLKALERMMEEAVTRSAVTGDPFSFLVLDIDHYPAIVETSGQKMADRVILAIARSCRSFTTGNEFLARCREGIFSIIIPAQPLKYAGKRAKRLCKGIASERYTVEDSQPGCILSFTVSIGLSCHARGDNSRDVAERALKALYAAKRAGGNRVLTEKALSLRFRQGSDIIEPLY